MTHNTRYAEPVAAAKLPIALNDLPEMIHEWKYRYGEDLVTQQRGQHLVVFTEGILCECGYCQTKVEEVVDEVFPMTMRRMTLCAECGNKRCPHSYSHEFVCTGSNEPDQTLQRLPEFRLEQEG